MTTNTNDLRQRSATDYADGGDMGIAHMYDALASGLTLGAAVAYAKDMILSAERGIAEGTPPSKRIEARVALRAAHGVNTVAHMSHAPNRKLA